ncbi:response regulator [Streptomyces sp. HNM0574]|uniref:response regulator n=1 Tax=Streptomyces sp. HNM0574 TaxID=2714954 RepID=UPI00146DE9AC|nr:response regulator [Streptomyces sp. HNM0574]NLU67144.1 response regulator [Streptomyces sp. HNM0574]
MSGRVLVVDDNKVIRQLIKVNLELEGFEVVTAADGVECLEAVHRVRPDVVTLDVAMPRLDGLRTADRLRSDPRTRHIPAAIISGCTGHGDHGGPESAAAGRWHGVDAVLAKPFEPADLVRTVRRLMRGERGLPDGYEEAVRPGCPEHGSRPDAAAREREADGVPEGEGMAAETGPEPAADSGAGGAR